MITDTKYITKINDFGEVAQRQHSFYGSGFITKMIEKETARVVYFPTPREPPDVKNP